MTFTEKYLTSLPPIEAANRQVKRYHNSPVGRPIEDEVEEAAYRLLPALLPAVDEETPPASFAVLHRGMNSGAYLVAYSWVWGNVIECASAVAGIPFLGCADECPDNFTTLTRPWMGCVWELAPLGHERSAWVRHVLAPAQPDLPAYLSDVVADGLSGGAA
jgi:hypothetical protein